MGSMSAKPTRRPLTSAAKTPTQRAPTAGVVTPVAASVAAATSPLAMACRTVHQVAGAAAAGDGAAGATGGYACG
jgi:hypothetical protein